MTPAERLAFYTKEDEELQVLIKATQDNLHDLLKNQHVVRREIFKAQFDVRRPNG